MAYHMYVSLQGDDAILRFSMDTDTGALELLEKVSVAGGPAPLVMSPERDYLYVGRRAVCALASYSIDQQTGALTDLGSVPLDAEPCYLGIDRSGNYVFSAYYAAGKAAVHPIDGNGVAHGPPVEWRDTATGAHCFQTDPSNRFAFVPHIAIKGPNAIFQFKFDQRTGQLTPNTPLEVTPEHEDGPRHYCFHPSKNLVYFSNEQGCSVTAYQLDTAQGTLAPLQTVPTLPADHDGSHNSCSQIQITPSGRFLYAPNRGHNSIACFAVDTDTGLLTPVGHAAAEPVPRAFGIDPDGKFLFAAGLESGRLTSYRINDTTGMLGPLEVYTVGARPMWVLITPLAG